MVSEDYGEEDISRLGGDEDGYEGEEDENSKQSVSKFVPKSRAAQSNILFGRNFLNCPNIVPFHAYFIPSPLQHDTLVSVKETGLDISSSV